MTDPKPMPSERLLSAELKALENAVILDEHHRAIEELRAKVTGEPPAMPPLATDPSGWAQKAYDKHQAWREALRLIRGSLSGGPEDMRSWNQAIDELEVRISDHASELSLQMQAVCGQRESLRDALTAEKRAHSETRESFLAEARDRDRKLRELNAANATISGLRAKLEREQLSNSRHIEARGALARRCLSARAEAADLRAKLETSQVEAQRRQRDYVTLAAIVVDGPLDNLVEAQVEQRAEDLRAKLEEAELERGELRDIRSSLSAALTIERQRREQAEQENKSMAGEVVTARKFFGDLRGLLGCGTGDGLYNVVESRLADLTTLRAKCEELEAELHNARVASDGSMLPDGKEAEELRQAIEAACKASDDDGLRSTLNGILDEVDARDSLAFLEHRDRLRATSGDGLRAAAWSLGKRWSTEAGYLPDIERRDAADAVLSLLAAHPPSAPAKAEGELAELEKYRAEFPSVVAAKLALQARIDNAVDPLQQASKLLRNMRSPSGFSGTARELVDGAIAALTDTSPTVATGETKRECSHCKGKGRVNGAHCGNCSGTGTLTPAESGGGK